MDEASLTVAGVISLVVKLFAFGLFITIILNWIAWPPAEQVRVTLNRFYDIFLNPLRRCIRPIKLFPSAPVGIDLTPFILLLLVWWLIHPFLMWIFG